MRLLSIPFILSIVASAAKAQELAQLVANDPGGRDALAQSLAMSGSTIIASSKFDDPPEVDRGSAYVFVGGGASWTQQAKLTASDGKTLDYFSSSVAVSGDTAAIGAYGDDHVDFSNSNQGSAYVFVRAGTVWTQQAKLIASDAALNDQFGLAIAVQADTIAVGAPYDDDLGANSGSVYVFVRTGTVWTQQAKVTAGDGIAGDLFGTSLSIDADTLIVGSERHNDGGANSGSVYVFVRSGTAWSQQAKLNASDGSANELLGHSVSLAGDSLVVGAYQKDQGRVDAGCAYVFTRTGTTWTERTKLVASDGGSFDYFGRTVAIVPGAIVVGACQKKVIGKCSGAAYIFHGSGASWTQTSRVTPSETAPLDFFGSAVAASGALAVVGSPFDDDTANLSGSAHVFPLESEGTQYCFPGTGGTIACPCGQPANPSGGCANFGAGSTSGAVLSASGTPSVSADTVVLTASNHRGPVQGVLNVFFSFKPGSATPTTGLHSGAGVRCIGTGGNLRRLYTVQVFSGTGSKPGNGDLSVSAKSATFVGHAIVPPETRHYFNVYRDGQAATPCGSTATSTNLTNGLAITWSL